MKIMENKRVTALAVLMLIVFGFLCYYGYEQYRILAEAQTKIAEERSKLEGYEEEELPPTRDNSRYLSQAASTMSQLTGELRAGLEAFAKACRAEGTDIRPDRFQKDVNDMTTRIAAYAQEKKCTLSPEAAALGLNEYKTASATERDAPYLNFLLHAADNVVRTVIDSGAPSITRFYCAPLPEKELSARKQPPYFPLEMEIAFTARRGAVDLDPAKEGTLSVLPRVINSLVSDKKYFLIITGIAVNSSETLPMMPSYKAPKEVGDSLIPPAAGDEAKEENSEPVAKLITGREGVVNVHVTLQVLYFTTDKL